MNKMLIKVSIIVVSLNTKIDFLKTIESIKRQTYKNYETIVVDGKSNDGTVDEINKIKDNLSNFIIEKDTGIYDAMNKGIKMSSGKWIIFMNSGDLFYKKDTLHNFLSKNTNNYDIVYGDTVIKTKYLKYVDKSKPFEYKTFLMPFCHQSVFVKSNILKRKNFSLKYKCSSDFDFFYHCFLSGMKFKKINYIISKVKSDGFADKNRQRVFNENLMIIKKKGNKTLVYLLYLKKISQYIKDLLKFLLPSSIEKFILRIKHNKNLMN